MFNSKQEVIEGIHRFSRQYNVPLDRIVVGGGAALMLMDLRKSTQDLNLWIDNPHFRNIAEDHRVMIHPLRDTVIQLPKEGYYLRHRNEWFNCDEIDGITVFDVLSLIILKRGGHGEHKRPADKREQDYKDLVALAQLHAERNKVCA